MEWHQSTISSILTSVREWDTQSEQIYLTHKWCKDQLKSENPSITIEEINHAIYNPKNEKAVDQVNVSVELLKLIEDEPTRLIYLCPYQKNPKTANSLGSRGPTREIVNEQAINNLQYANNTTIIICNPQDLENILDNINRVSQDYGLKIILKNWI